MPSKEEEFKQRFVTVLDDLQENGQKDPEAMWLIGSLACELVEKVGAASWTEFKRTASQQTHNKLLTDFQNEGNRQFREGDRKKAFAIQVLGISLIAPTQKDADLRAGDVLLDGMIEGTIRMFRQSRTKN